MPIFRILNRRIFMADATRPGPTEDERSRFRILERIRQEVRDCQFVKTWNGKTQTISWSAAANEITAPEYDWDHFRSFLTIVRKMTMDKEPSHVLSLAAIVGRYDSADDTIELLKILKKRITTNPAGALAWVIHAETPREKHLHANDLFDIVVNAGVFHSDPQREELWRELEPDREFWVSMVHGHAIAVVNLASFILSRCYQNQWLKPPPGWTAKS